MRVHAYQKSEHSSRCQLSSRPIVAFVSQGMGEEGQGSWRTVTRRKSAQIERLNRSWRSGGRVIEGDHANEEVREHLNMPRPEEIELKVGKYDEEMI